MRAELSCPRELMLREDERAKEDEDDEAYRLTREAKRGWGVASAT